MSAIGVVFAGPQFGDGTDFVVQGAALCGAKVEAHEVWPPDRVLRAAVTFEGRELVLSAPIPAVFHRGRVYQGLFPEAHVIVHVLSRVNVPEWHRDESEVFRRMYDECARGVPVLTVFNAFSEALLSGPEELARFGLPGAPTFVTKVNRWCTNPDENGLLTVLEAVITAAADGHVGPA